MRQTDEQVDYGKVLLADLDAAGLGRVKTRISSSDGFLEALGRSGVIEYFGPEPGGMRRLRAYTPKRGIISPLLKVPGVHVQQRGDTELRVWFPAGKPDTLRAVCGVLKMRQRRGTSYAGADAARMAEIRRRRSFPRNP